jgi:hypothetical protein
MRKWGFRAVLAVGFGLGVGASAAALSSLSLGVHSAYAAGGDTCSVSGSVATITLGGVDTTISDVGGNLDLDGTSSDPCVVGSTTTTTNFALADGTISLTGSAASLTLDQTGSGGVFPSTLDINNTGSLGGPVTVVAAPGEVLSFGSTGFTLDYTPASTHPTVNEVIWPDIDLSGVTQPYVVSASAAVTVSGDGTAVGDSGTGTGGNTSSPVTLQAGNDSSGTYGLDGNVDFEAQVAGTYNVGVSPTSSANVIEGGVGTETINVPGQITGVRLVGSSSPTSQDTFNANYSEVKSGTEVGDTGNTLIGGAGTDVFNLTPSTGNPDSDNTYQGGSGTDTVNIDGSNNVFKVGSGPETFVDPGSSNKVDFSSVGASSGAELYVNVSGQSEQPATVLLSNGQANLAGSTVVDTFHDSATSTTSADFTTFDGASGGYTTFLAGGSGGLTFAGQASQNSAEFLGGNGVVVNLSSGLQTVTTSLGTSSVIDENISGFQIGAGEALVAPTTSTSCSGSPIASFCDSLTGVNTVTGPSAGYSTFYAGSSPSSFSFSDPGNDNTFIGGTGQVAFSSAGNFNTYVAGVGQETFTETTSSQEPSNQIDFSALPVGSETGCTNAPCSLVVNVSGTATQVPNFVAALLSGSSQQIATYSFGNSSGGPDFTSFIGSSGGDTTFDGGSIVGSPPNNSPTYQGQGVGNTLNFEDVPSSVATTLVLNVNSTPFPQSTLGTVPETFSGITNLLGLSEGNTTFDGGSTGGYTFTGDGSGNKADFTAQGPSTTLTVTVKNGSNVPVSTGSVSFYIPGQSTPICTAVPSSSGVASCYASLPAGTTQVEAVYTPQSGSSSSGSAYLFSGLGSSTSGATSTTLSVSPTPPNSGATIYQGETVTLTAHVTVTQGGAPVTSGTVTFSIAGQSGSLCEGVSVSSGVAVCQAVLPAGTDDILAVYSPGASLDGSAAQPDVVSVADPQQTSVVVNSYSSPGFLLVCNAIDTLDCLQATVSGIPTGASGTVSFYYDSTTLLCSVSGVTSSSDVASCSPEDFGVDVFAGYNVVAVFTPDTVSGVAAGVDSSVSPVFAVATGCGYFPCDIDSPPSTATTVTLTAGLPGSPTAGTQYTLQATVSSTVDLPGGTITFGFVGANGLSQLCSVPVPSGVLLTPELECSAQLPAGAGTVVVFYNPSNSTFFGSSAQQTGVDVGAPTSTTDAGATPTTNLNPGVTVNLSSGSVSILTATVTLTAGTNLAGGTVTFSDSSGTICSAEPVVLVAGSTTQATATCVTSALPGGTTVTGTYKAPAGGNATGTVSVTGVVVQGGAVLVAAPPSGSSPSCAVTPLPTFCDALNNVSVVTGSSGGGNTFVAGSSSETFADTGSTGGDTIDFQYLSAGNGAPLSVNVSGVGTSDYTATLGSATYTFTTGGAGFTNLIGSNGGFTTFLASGTGGYIFSGYGTNNTVSFADDANPVIANLSGNSYTFDGFTVPSADVLLDSASGSTASCATGGCDSISDITTIVGSGGGGNDFVAGDSNEVFQGGSGNTVDFSELTTSVVVNVSAQGQSPQSTAYGTATSGGFTYDFTAFDSSPTTFIGGGDGNTTFYAGSIADTFEGSGTTTGNTLNFSLATGLNLTVNVKTVGLDGCAKFGATLGTTTNCFEQIQTFVGLSNSGTTTTFIAGNTPGYTFTGVGGSNALNFAGATSGIVVNLSNSAVSESTTGGTVSLNSDQVWVTSPLNGDCQSDAALCDSFSDITSVTGSSSGGNYFIAGPGSETFADGGSSKTDTIDFSELTAGNGSPLTINVSGIGTSAYTATFGSATYNFTTGGTDFVDLIGSAGGYTTFDASASYTSTARYVFTGQGGNNVISLATAPCSIQANLAAGTIGCLPNSGHPSPTTDSISAISTIIGSSLGGNDFIAADNQGSEVFEGGTDNTVDFHLITNPVVVNVSSSTPQGIAVGTATSGGDTYDFSNFVADPTTFIGSASGTTFFAGNQLDTFDGNGSDTLNFTDASGTDLVICQAASASAGCSSADTALIGTTTEFFNASITTFDGLSGSGSTTTFVADSTGGLTFNGEGGTNTVDFSAQGSGIVANLSNGTVTEISPVTGKQIVVASQRVYVGAQPTANTTCGGNNCDTITGITSVVGAAVGDNIFVAGSTSETFADPGSNASDTIDFSGIRTTTSNNQLIINASSTSANGLSPFTAVFGAVTYTFGSGGTDFVDFAGATSGNTHFQASGTQAGLEFTGIGSGNIADFSQVVGDVTLDMATTPARVTINVGTGSQGVDKLSGSVATVIGSSVGANTFYGSLLGTNFTSSSDTNTLSYADYTFGGSPVSGEGVIIDFTSDHVSLSCPTGTAGCQAGTGVDTFSFPAGGTLTAQGSSGPDHFIIGTQAVTIEGGGGDDVLDLSKVPASSAEPGVGVDFNQGSDGSVGSGQVSGPSIAGVTFTPGAYGSGGCTNSTDLCLTEVIGSVYNDTFTVAPTSLNVGVTTPLTIEGNGGVDTLDLSQIPTAATVNMPLGTLQASCGVLANVTCGTVAGTASLVTGIDFTGITDLLGTQPGGDLIYVGKGTETLTEIGSATGTLNFSKLPASGSSGVDISVNEVSGTPEGTVTSPIGLVTDTFTGFASFYGTASGNDTYQQTGAGDYNFQGGGGQNTLNLTNAPTGLTVSFVPSGATCAAGSNNDGSAIGGGVDDTFSCMSSVLSSGSLTFEVSPGQSATLNGGGSGTLELIGTPTGGATINLDLGTYSTVSGGGYDFSFTGMTTIDGTGLGDTFVAGPGNYTINEPTVGSTITFANAPNAVVVNDSNSNYIVPSGYGSLSGTTVPAFSTSGGYGGTYTINGISNIIGTTRYNDVLVAGSGPGTLVGGNGSVRFVLTGGNDTISAGTGASTLDLSELSGQTALDLGTSAPQVLGPSAGSVTLLSGSVSVVIASPGGSQIWGANGTVTLQGGAGNDWLAAGDGTQTLIGGGGNDTLIGGIGNDTLEGGAQPVTFEPGQGNDTLTSQTTGNTLSYQGNPNAVDINLSTNNYTIPTGEPFAGTSRATLAADTATGGWGAVVSLSPGIVTNVVGTPEDDIFVTGSGDTITGSGGDDLFVIDGGNNTLTAGTGTESRFLFAGAGTNTIYGGGDSTVDFSQAPNKVLVNLQAGIASGGFDSSADAPQSLNGILNVVGTNQNGDILVGGSSGGTLTSGTGSGDFLESGGGGATLVADGSQATFCAESSCAYQGTVAGGGDIMQGTAGVDDTFFAQNGVYDELFGVLSDTAYADTKDEVVGIGTVFRA